ncbi:MAG TPA: FAD-dependent oxidoreductase [Acidobacteriaceae bacterium]|nr:FAD-dependent oxidoreductase [Acidobacteriaceae bacterium]
MNNSHVVDVAIAGGGIIGLSLALELRQRGLSVMVIERGQAMSSASWAAGGMLAVNDPQNPPKLMPLCIRSWELYPSYLARIEALSGCPVPLRTQRALQEQKPEPGLGGTATAAEIAEFAPGLDPDGHSLTWLDEGSLDPNDLREALPTAVRAAGGMLLEGTEVLSIETTVQGVVVVTERERISAGMWVNCCGAWAGQERLGGVPVEPVKGQMANLRCAPELLRCVVRTAGVYLVPRGDGRVTIGATLEHAGFDETVESSLIRPVIDAALRLLPEAHLSSPLDAWAGLRPGTPDGLPILGAARKENCWHATGHYRDGILLAPVTARVMAQAMLGETPDVSLDAFSPARFGSD